MDVSHQLDNVLIDKQRNVRTTFNLGDMYLKFRFTDCNNFYLHNFIIKTNSLKTKRSLGDYVFILKFYSLFLLGSSETIAPTAVDIHTIHVGRIIAH